MALTKTMTMLKSLLPVLHPRRTFQFHHRHCCLRPAVARSVGCLPCCWLTAAQTKIRTDYTRPPQTYRCKFWCACHSASLPSSLPVVSGGHVSTCYTLLAHFTQMQTTRSRIVTIRHTLCRTEWVQSCYKRSQHVTCYQLAQNSFVGFTGKFQYLQILLLLPVLPNNVTCKIHGIHYPQFLLLANSTPFTAKINYLQIQRPPHQTSSQNSDGVTPCEGAKYRWV